MSAMMKRETMIDAKDNSYPTKQESLGIDIFELQCYINELEQDLIEEHTNSPYTENRQLAEVLCEAKEELALLKKLLLMKHNNINRQQKPPEVHFFGWIFLYSKLFYVLIHKLESVDFLDSVEVTAIPLFVV